MAKERIVFIVHRIVVYVGRIPIVDEDALGKGREHQCALAVVGHVVELVAIEVGKHLPLSRNRVETEDGMAGAQPVLLFFVAVDELYVIGGIGMAD